ncbi:unnamed protein product, partial [Prorocentrum cordatum]
PHQPCSAHAEGGSGAEEDYAGGPAPTPLLWPVSARHMPAEGHRPPGEKSRRRGPLDRDGEKARRLRTGAASEARDEGFPQSSCRFMIAALRTSDRPRHSLSATAARDSGKMPTRGVQHTLPCRKLCRLMALSSKT